MILAISPSQAMIAALPSALRALDAASPYPVAVSDRPQEDARALAQRLSKPE
jgi:hypothetical protein